MLTKPQHSEIPDTKSAGPTSALRRSKRVILELPLVIRGEGEDKRPFQEETFTISVSAHGALVVLAGKVALGQKVSLENLKTHAEIEGRIARFGPPYGGLAQVGIEFARPAPEFWSNAVSV